MKSNLIILLLILCTAVFSQQEHSVLIPDLQGSYQGKMKKGLAHGKGIAKGVDHYEGKFKKGLPNGFGTYTWANGDVYIGEWQKGLRSGNGKLIYSVNNLEIVKEGLWNDDQYLGPKPRKLVVLRRENVIRYKCDRVGSGNRVLVDVYQDGSQNTELTDYFIVSNSGGYTNLGNLKGFDDIIFPVQLKINYRSWNALHTYLYDVVFEVEIFEAGDWRIYLHN
ncbi:MAG: hypothetical protein JEZ03_10455 [Bacteroidales bacterium]|nr:hypothetical protein [Bacteroidales bacterium]